MEAAWLRACAHDGVGGRRSTAAAPTTSESATHPCPHLAAKTASSCRPALSKQDAALEKQAASTWSTWVDTHTHTPHPCGHPGQAHLLPQRVTTFSPMRRASYRGHGVSHRASHRGHGVSHSASHRGHGACRPMLTQCTVAQWHVCRMCTPADAHILHMCLGHKRATVPHAHA